MYCSLVYCCPHGGHGGALLKDSEATPAKLKIPESLLLDEVIDRMLQHRIDNNRAGQDLEVGLFCMRGPLCTPKGDPSQIGFTNTG